MPTPDSPACPTPSYALARAAVLGRCRCGKQSFGGRYELHYDDVEDAAATAETGNLTSSAGEQRIQMRAEARKTKALEARFAQVYRTYRSISTLAALQQQ